MTELKTLKDFKKIRSENRIFSEETIDRHIEDLRQAAIKWIKELEYQVKLIETNNFHLPYQPTPGEWIKCEGLLSKRDWIKHFFNITEEEIK